MIDNDTEKPSRFEEAVEKAPTLTGLRASNTVETLKPREVAGYDTPSGGHVTLEEVLAPQKAYELAVQNESSPGIVKPEPTFVQNCTNPSPANIQKIEHTADGPRFTDDPEVSAKIDIIAARLGDRLQEIAEGKELPKPANSGANVLSVDWPASGLPGKYGSQVKDWSPVNKAMKPVLLPGLTERVQKLEEQVDALLDRIAHHNIRSSHKI